MIRFQVLIALSILLSTQLREPSIATFRGLAFVPVRIAASQPLSFLLDTGTVGTLVSTSQAEHLHLKREGSEKTYGIGDDTVFMSLSKDVPLQVADLVLSPETVGVYDFDDLDHRLGRHIDGVIGTSVFRHNVVDLDFSQNSIRFFDPRRYSDSGRGTVVHLQLDSQGIPFVNVRVTLRGGESLTARLCVDTGSTEAISFNRPFVEKHHLLETLNPQLQTNERGYAGEAKASVARLESVTLGEYVIQKPIVGLSQAQQGATTESSDDGTIGMPLLSRFHIVFNYSRDIMIIEPNSGFEDPFEYDMSGLRLLADGDDLKKILVAGVVSGSPAASAGVRPDDLLTNVDGIPAEDLNLERLDNYLKQDGRDISMTVQRGLAPLYVRFTLKRLL